MQFNINQAKIFSHSVVYKQNQVMLMIRSLLNQAKSTANKNYLTTICQQRSFKDDGNNNNNNRSKIGQTTILVQDGCDIQELPVVVRKIGQDEFLSLCNNLQEISGFEEKGCPESNKVSAKYSFFINLLNLLITG